MKKLFALSSILLASALTSAFAFTESHPAFAASPTASLAPAPLMSAKKMTTAGDWFDYQIMGMVTNTLSAIYIDHQLSIPQIIQLLEVLRINHSVTSLYIEDNNRLFCAGADYHNGDVLVALDDALAANKGIRYIILNNLGDTKELDLFSLQHLSSIITRSNIEGFSFGSGWFTTDAVAQNITFLIKNTLALKQLRLIIDADDSSNAPIALAQALDGVPLEYLYFSGKYKLNGQPFFPSLNPATANAFFQSILSNTTLKSLTFADFIIDTQAANRFATAFQKMPVEELVLDNNRLDDTTFALIQPALQQNNSVQWLALPRQNFSTITTFTNLVNLYLTKALRGYNISYSFATPIDIDNIIALSNKLATDKILTHLLLGDVGIDDAQAIQLTHALHRNEKLEFIGLDGNTYTENGARLFMDVVKFNPIIKYIHLNQKVLTLLPPEEVASFFAILGVRQTSHPE